MYRHLSHFIFTAAQCVTDQLATDLLVKRSKVVMVPSGVAPPDTLPEKEDAVRNLQRELDLPPTARFIGSVAMLRDWKGHRFLLDGFAQIADRFDTHHLVIVGDGDEMDPLKRQRASLGLSRRIHFTGFRDNPWPYYRAFDVKVLASTKNELMSQVLPQAMLCGCPVIGTRVGGIPDILKDGLNGLLVEPQSASALAGAITQTLAKPDATRSRVRCASEIVPQRFTIDAMGQTILGLYAQAFSAC
jgi:glycosyltransferase involved in cell wall biosynthesis